MAIDTTDLATIYDEFLKKSVDELISLQKETQMEDEHYATVVSNIISAAMENSVRTLQVLKANQLVDAQILSEGASQALKEQQKTSMIAEDAIKAAQSEKDLLVKDAQRDMLVAQEATETKKALDVASTTASRDANSTVDVINKGKQGLIYDQQVLKLIADTAFVQKQTLELGNSVIFNNNIKALDSYADMIGTMGAGGLVISSDMWSKFFAMVHALNENGAVPTSTTIVKA